MITVARVLGFYCDLLGEASGRRSHRAKAPRIENSIGSSDSRLRPFDILKVSFTQDLNVIGLR